MVQAKMGLAPYQEEIIDVVPQAQKIKKKIEVNGVWEDRQFIRIPIRGVDRLAQGNSDLEKWCRERCGEPRYLGPWFKVSGYIVLDEKTYVWWKLCE